MDQLLERGVCVTASRYLLYRRILLEEMTLPPCHDVVFSSHFAPRNLAIIRSNTPRIRRFALQHFSSASLQSCASETIFAPSELKIDNANGVWPNWPKMVILLVILTLMRTVMETMLRLRFHKPVGCKCRIWNCATPSKWYDCIPLCEPLVRSD